MKIAVVLGSVRTGRMGERVARWAMAETSKIDGAEVSLVDVKEFGLPMFDDMSPGHRTEPYSDPAARAWSEVMAAADAYVVVTAEYDHGVPGALANALDYLWNELTDKPAAIVSYSTGPIGGARSGYQLAGRLIYMQLLIAGTVEIPRVDTSVDETGELLIEGPDKALAKVLTRLEKLAKLAD